jgi:thiamine pyrophosphokinase
MRGVIFVNGRVDDYAPLARRLQPDDLLVGADGGTRHILALGLQPNIVVGDLDSLPAAVVEELIARGIAIERHPTSKDQTDLELAIECALRQGVDEILMLGGMGGRLDQTLANLLILAQRDWPVPLRLVEGPQIASIVCGPGRLVLHGVVGATVSVIPLSAAARGITYTGLRYPLHAATLALGSTRGVSNEFAATTASIELTAGLLLVVQTEPAMTGANEIR